MPNTRTVPTLDAAMDDAVQGAQEMMAYTELSHPYAHIWTDDGALALVALALGNSRDTMGMLTLQVAADDAALVMLFFESWVARTSVTTDDPDMAKLIAREISVSDLPPEKRGDGLTVVGETRDGQTAFRQFAIAGKPGQKTPRTFTENTKAPSRVTGVMTKSLFVFRTLQKETGCTEREARWHAREMATRVLARSTA